MLRAAKNSNGTIVCIGNDEDQHGNYPIGTSDLNRLGVWCEWVFENPPAISPIEGAEERANRFKENEAADGMELRDDADVLADPQG